MKTITLNEINFDNDSIFSETLESLVKTDTLADLCTHLYDHCFGSWNCEPNFSLEQMFAKLKNEWVNAGGEAGIL